MKPFWQLGTVIAASAIFAAAASSICEAQPAWDEALAPWASDTDPTDAPKSHVEVITAPRQQYTVTQGGTMDGQNCRMPFGVFEGAELTWESNRAVRIENAGRTDVVNPWLSNGRNNFRNIHEILAAAIEPDMTDKEKALALWYQEVTHRYHWQGDNNELGDPVRVFNVYGHNTCGNDSICMAGLWTAAGLRVSPARPLTHCISQAFYDGRWHLLDADMQGLYLLRDNQTIASEQDLVHDHDLVKRTHTHGILHPNSRPQDERQASIFVYEGPAKGTRTARADTTMNMTLRPGEAIMYRWGHLEPIKYHGTDKPRYPHAVSNSLWTYRPDFSDELWRRGAETVDGVRTTDGGLAAEPGKTATIVWKMHAPYPFVGGRLTMEGQGARFELSEDAQTWTDVSNGVLDYLFPSEWGPFYEFLLRCRLEGDARLKSLTITADLQTSPLGMPGMVVGENRFTYTDQSPGERNVRITHRWVERSASRPPQAPPAPVSPTDGGETDGTDVVFRWSPPEDSDGDSIVDYQWQLADRADMRWPLSSNFWKLISRTPDKGKPQYTLPYVGLLTPDRTYYWRVRARDDKGLWGPWSQTWSFTPHGPTPPVDVRLDFDPQLRLGTLRWKPNPVGRPPVKYRVYGSDEKGFSISDEPYEVNLGEGKTLSSPFPANFIAESTDTALVVVGEGLDLPEANKAYYRVVAVDQNGNRSWSSAYATAPRPFIYTRPVTTAKTGTPYRYQAAAVRSLGDARYRGDTGMGFWDVEHPRFSLTQGPDWLTIDESTGLLSGTPQVASNVQAVVTAVIDRQVRQLDETALSWGLYTVAYTTTERVGDATQKFTISVGRP
jgi:hypothetical protein